jgi:AcrR family transcriptional regulator
MAANTSQGEYHRGNLREAILAASLQLIAEKGVDALTLREIGRLAGVSRMAAYRHFADKRDLLGAIAEAGFLQFTTALEQARDAAGPEFAHRFAALGRAYIDFARQHPAHYQVMFNWAALPQASQADQNAAAPSAPCSWQIPAQRSFQILVEVIAEGQHQGEVRAGDPVAMAQVVWATVHGIVTLRFSDPASGMFSSADMAQLSSEILRRGLSSS